MRPSSPVCGVTSFMPRMCPASDAASSADFASFTPPAFAASAGMNLRLHDNHRGAQPLRRRARFVFLEDHFAARHRNAEFR